jgi:sugar lactone lactonase YvrE
LADGFSFTEGPVWHPDGFLLFSDPNLNVIYRYNPINKNVTITSNAIIEPNKVIRIKGEVGPAPEVGTPVNNAGAPINN